jgi:hypothetical protein
MASGRVTCERNRIDAIRMSTHRETYGVRTVRSLYRDRIRRSVERILEGAGL